MAYNRYMASYKFPAARHPIEYRIWSGMKARCRPTDANAKHYHDRGITVCQEWIESFDAFYIALGDRPDGFTLERLNNDLGYFPGNVAWRSRSDNNSNRRPWKHTAETIEAFRRAKASTAKCDWAAVREDWETSDLTQREIALKYGVSQPCISQHRKREGWLYNRHTIG